MNTAQGTAAKLEEAKNLSIADFLGIHWSCPGRSVKDRWAHRSHRCVDLESEGLRDD